MKTLMIALLLVLAQCGPGVWEDPDIRWDGALMDSSDVSIEE